MSNSDPAPENFTHIDLSLRCFQCRRLAYTDCFRGEFGVSGYICVDCIRSMNRALVQEIKDRFFEEKKHMARKE